MVINGGEVVIIKVVLWIEVCDRFVEINGAM